MNVPDEKVMRTAIELAQSKYQEGGGHAVAAIIVRNDKIIAKAFTTIIRDVDPTAHAEINAIRQAAKKLNSRFLYDCYLYTTYEPCPMCTSAAVWAKVKGVIYGASRLDETPQAHWRVQISSQEVISRGTPKLELWSNFMRAECQHLLSLQ